MRFLLFFISFYCLSCQLYAFDNLKFHTLSQKGGLSYDGIIDIEQDGRGLMWILLGGNLFRFDGYSYKSYKKDFHNDPENRLIYFNNLATDRYGEIYTSTSHGVYQYDYKADRFTKIIEPPVQSIYIDHRNIFWIASNEGFSFLGEKNKPVTPSFTGNKASLNKRTVCENGNDLYFFSMYGKIYRYDLSGAVIDEWANFEVDFESASLVDASIRNDALWILTSRFSILKIDLKTKKVIYKYRYPDFHNINLRCLYVSNEGIPWIGTINGLYVLNPETDDIYLYQNNKNEGFTIPNNSVWTINEDNQGNVWIGTYMGSLAYVNRYEEKIFETHYLSSDGLNNAPVSGFTAVGNTVWISTEGGGINIFDKSERNFSYLQQNQDQHGLSSNNTKPSIMDKEGNIWIPTFRGGLNRYNPTTRQFTHFRRKPGDTHSIYSDNIRKIILEPDSGLWIIYQQHTATISFFSFEKDRFSHFIIDEDLKGAMDYDYIYDSYRDTEERLWIITSYWLFSRNVKSGEWRKYPIPAKNNPASTLCVDDNGIVWIGTFGNELIRFDPGSESFSSFPGILQSDIAEIYSMNHSMNHIGEQIIWLGTNDGLYMYNAVTNSCAVFKESDGTQGDVYYPLSTFKERNGSLYFGGTGGFTIIDPQKVTFNPLKPRAIISDFYIDNQSVLHDDIHKNNIEISHNLLKIKLNHKQLNFGFKLSSDNYLNADKNLFRYRLKNYDDRWIQTDASNRTIFYSKIPAGRYDFEFQTANNDGIWGDIHSVKIIRKQTPWLSIPALILYFLSLSLLIYYFFRTDRKRKELEMQLYLDQIEKEKNEEIHKNQLQFFTNISHDLKTPLSLIMITINKMREEGMREYYYKILNSNSERLLGLLNDILDFRKIQHNKVKINVSQGNLSEFIQAISGDFMEYARQKQINYQIVTDDDTLYDTPFDKKVMEKIIMNLLINSFKYTRKGDSISITAGVKDFRSKYLYSYTIGEENLGADETFSIVVSDTGVGISKESISKVFDRFYQVESKNQRNHMGTGIGLALVKNLVLLHKGSITIYSERNTGSDFVVTLPSSISHYLPSEVQLQSVEDTETGVDIGESSPEDFDQTYPETDYKAALSDDLSGRDEAKEKTILLAEDSTDLRAILKSSLGENYEVVGFDDGKPALEYLKENDVDLIISDIMMPEIDGITFCKNIKNNLETSHIPFIMLTAKTGIESMLEGTESGADLYFEKPVDLTLLKTSIANIFKQKEVLREYYAKNYFAEISNISSNKQDNQFLREISEIIDDYLDQSDLDVNTIASKMMMSRSKLYSKIKTLTGKSVVEFILSYRLRRAARFLVESNMNIQQAMYAVGIESQSYFTKSFKKEFNMPPSKFVLKHKEDPRLDI